MRDTFAAMAELKFLDNEPAGTFGGLGAVFGNIDSHGDLIVPGAFAASLAEHKARGTMPRMFVEHSAYLGGDPLPVGVWEQMEEEAGGLRVKGRLIALDHPDVKRVADLMTARVLGGLSIGFPTPKGDAAEFGKRAGEPRRTLKRVNLLSVDIVADPSNPQARIQEMKSIMLQADQQAACDAVAAAMQVHRDSMSGGNSPTVEQRSVLMQHLQTAHMALTGSPLPRGMKSAPTLREAEAAIREMFGLSNAQAREITEHGLKSWLSRDESDREQVEVTAGTLEEIKSLSAGFSFSSLS